MCDGWLLVGLCADVCASCRYFSDERAKIQTLGVNVNELIVIAAKKLPVKRDPLYLPAYFYLGSYNSKTAQNSKWTNS